METVYNVWLVDFELRQMAAFLKVLKISLEDYAQKIDNGPTDSPWPTEQEIEEDDEANDRFNAWTDEVLSVSPGGDFHRRLYSTFLISFYSFVEDNLLKLCEDSNLPIETKPGKGIWGARDRIQNNTLYQFDPEQWKELTLINKTRNQLVHNGGRFTYSLEKANDQKNYVLVNQNEEDYYVYIEGNLYEYLKKHGLIHFYGTFFIKPSPEYCEHLVAFGKSLFENLFEGLGLT